MEKYKDNVEKPLFQYGLQSGLLNSETFENLLTIYT